MTPFRILFLAFIFFVTSGLAQTKKDLHFFSHYSPNTVYQQSLVQSATNHMKYTGSKEFRENIEKKGIKNPSVTETSSTAETVYATGSFNTDSIFPLTLTFLKSTSSTGKNQIPDGTLIYGHGTTIKMPVLDSIVSDGLSTEIKTMLLQVLQSTYRQIDIPAQDLNVGETFKSVTPLSIPIAGVTLDMDITTYYKLISINNGIAHFAVTQEYTMKSVITKYQIKATGEGKGTLLYDISNSFYNSYEVKSKMDMTLEAEGFGIELTSSSTYLQTTKISHN